MPVLEAVEGHYLLGGRTIDDGTVFDRFFDALYVMNETITDNEKAGRRVEMAKVVSFEGTVSVLIRENNIR